MCQATIRAGGAGRLAVVGVTDDGHACLWCPATLHDPGVTTPLNSRPPAQCWCRSASSFRFSNCSHDRIADGQSEGGPVAGVHDNLEQQSRLVVILGKNEDSRLLRAIERIQRTPGK